MDAFTSTSVPLAGALCVVGVVAMAIGIRRDDESRRLQLLGGAALVAGVLGLFTAPVWVQLAVFVVGTVAGWLLSWRWRSLLAEGNTLPTGAGAVRLVGMHGEVIDTIPPGDDARGWNDTLSGDRPAVHAGDRDPTSAVGRVRVEGETWRAQSRDGTEIATGTTVTVVRVRGTRLVVALKSDTDETAPTGSDDAQPARPSDDKEP